MQMRQSRWLSLILTVSVAISQAQTNGRDGTAKNVHGGVRESGSVSTASSSAQCQTVACMDASRAAAASARYLDTSDGVDWPGYGRTFGEQHYSPLRQINEADIGQLGLQWFMDLDSHNSVTIPIAIKGVIYFATGYSIVQAVDAVTGKLLWRYDPHAPEAAGLNLRLGWGSRGIAWWNGKIYTGTQDGRLIAIDAHTGAPIWTMQTFDSNSPRYISAAPRVFDGKVIIGHGGTTGKARGYVTAYDAENGKQLWRFYTVPGNPADGFESDAMKMAAKTWAGEWWKFGGGGDVWNAIAYDPDADTLFLGVGSAYPWNRRARSLDRGDNLFVASIVALDAKSGAYKWHYQVNPGDTWDYDAAMDIELANLTIDGRPRKVLLTAPKNGFFYVIDRTTGKLISAKPYTKVTWASRIDLKTGRPVEAPGARYPNGSTFSLWPSTQGAHSWPPMAYSPKSQLAYVPIIETGIGVSDAGINFAEWSPPTDRSVNGAVNGVQDGYAKSDRADKPESLGALVAWSPITQRAVWKKPYSTVANGGVLATGGDLVFQGNVDGIFRGYSANSGKEIWSFAAQAPILAAPITYSVNGKQYLTVLTGSGGTLALMGRSIEKYQIDPRSQARRVLTFALGANASIPPKSATPDVIADPDFKPDAEAAHAGQAVYVRNCAPCHGFDVISATHAPDLRRSAVPLSKEAFANVVRNGVLVPGGMPAFSELADAQLDRIRQYIRTEAEAARRTHAN